jgi:Transmembrane domain of unknown function (DUF3566)
MTATPEPPTPRAEPDDDSARPSVASSGGNARPPQRSGRRTVSSAPSSTATKPVAAPVEVEIFDDDDDDDTGTTTTTRSRRPTTPVQQTRPAPAPAPAPAAASPAPLAAMPVIRGERRFRQTITKVDLWTVLKLSLCFYLSAMFVTLVALVALWLIADAAGVIGSVEDFLGDLLSAKDFTFLSGEVLRGAILIALVIVALQVVITVIAASFYNIFAELFGGLEITVREEEVEPR